VEMLKALVRPRSLTPASGMRARVCVCVCVCARVGGGAGMEEFLALFSDVVPTLVASWEVNSQHFAWRKVPCQEFEPGTSSVQRHRTNNTVFPDGFEKKQTVVLI
jgi:hypothetical protein